MRRGIFTKLVILIVSLLCAVIVFRVCICERFIVRGDSMLPTLSNQDVIYVNKTIFGARIYAKPLFGRRLLQCFRLPGLRRCRVGDIVVFNYPYGGKQAGDIIHLTMNDICVKRCVGLPGDTISISKSTLYNSSRPVVAISTFLEDVQTEIDRYGISNQYEIQAGDFGQMQERWTIYDFGPFVIPKKGMTIAMDSLSVKLYSMLIKYENKVIPEIDKCYCFKKDWYFFIGDNLLVSQDSRHYGPVPEDCIIGVVSSLLTKH